MPILRWIGVNPQASTSSNHPRLNPQPTTSLKAADEAGASSADAKRFGLENFGNTCYANSVLQALYFCEPFRELVISSPDRSSLYPNAPSLLAPPVTVQSSSSPPTASAGKPNSAKNESRPSVSTHKPSGTHHHHANGDARTDGTTSKQEIDDPKSNTSNNNNNPNTPNSGPSISSSPPTIFSALRSLFIHISQHSHDKGTVAPQVFIAKLRKDNELFRSTMHQDAHEFLNYMLNRIVEDVEEEDQLLRKKERSSDGDKGLSSGNATGNITEDLSNSITTSATSSQPVSVSASGLLHKKTFIHALFEGTLTSETRCLTCETVSSRDEMFLDLSIDIEQNSSVTACLRQFSASEMLCQRDKFFCDACCGYQEAEKRMKVKRLPNILALHLKRFKYMEDQQRNVKLSYRVAFPFELRLFNTVDDAEDMDRLYELWAIVVHIGAGLLHGHYITIIKAQGTWYVFDDNSVDIIKESDIPKYYGDSGSGTGYVLFYRAADLDRESLGLPPLPPQSVPQVSKYPMKTEGGPPSPSVPISFEPASTTQVVTVAVDGEEPPPVPSRSPSPVAKLAKLEIPQPTAGSASATSATQPPSSSQSIPASTIPSATQSAGGFFSSLRHSRSIKADRTSLNVSSHPIPPVPTTTNGDIPVAAGASSNPVAGTGTKDKDEKSSGGGWLNFRSKEKRRDSVGRDASQAHSQTTSLAITTAPSSPRVPSTPLLPPPPSPRTIGKKQSTAAVNGSVQDVLQPLPPGVLPASFQVQVQSPQSQQTPIRRTSATDPPNVDGSDSLSGSSSWTSGVVAPVEGRELPPLPKDVPPVPPIPSLPNGTITPGALTEEPQMLAPTPSTTALNQSPGTSTWSIPSTPAMETQYAGEKIPIPPTLTMSSVTESTHTGTSGPTHSHQPLLSAAIGQSTNSVSASTSTPAAAPPPSPQRPFRQSTKDFREALKARKAADSEAKKAEEERKRVEKAEKEKEKAEKRRREAEKEREAEEKKGAKRASRKMSLGLSGLVNWGRDRDKDKEKDKLGISSLPHSTRGATSSEQPIVNGTGHSLDGMSPEDNERHRISLKPEAHFVPTINF